MGRSQQQPPWQYIYVWRFGPLGLIFLGLTMIVYAMIVNRSDAVTVGFTTLGTASAVAGVILPRAEGTFSASTTGVAASLASVVALDTADNFAISGPAVTGAPAEGEVTIGDVWEALALNGFEVVDAAAGSRELQDRRGRTVVLPIVDLAGSGGASSELLTQLRAWNIEPSPTGRYRSTEWLEFEHGDGRRPAWAP